MIRHVRTALAAVAGCAAFSVSAFAEPTVSANSWTGLYLGGHIGYGSGGADWQNTNVNPYSALAPNSPITNAGQSFSPDGVVAGVQVGANYQINQIVAGVEVSYSGTKLDQSAGITPGANVSPTAVLETDIRDLVLVTARLGYTPANSWLVYVKGGYAGANLNIKGTDFGGAGFNFENKGWSNGWTLGGGAEFKLSNRISLAIEYDHIELGSTTITGNIANLPQFPDIVKVSATVEEVTARLNIKLTP